MNPDPNQAKAIFLEAVEKHAPAEWPAFLDGACTGQADLRRRVEALLEAHRQAGTAQHPAAEGAAAVPVADSSTSPGAVLGPYKLLQEIGEGGMGTVWMAQQTEPVKRLVALKLIKAGMDSRQVIARFEAERQALALMDHANIARVLDAGTTDAGRPYFVMDLVKGVPITRYCDEHHLTPKQRLELFVPVCQAVQHAHQKGIIHRDLKPSNVLVALYDGKPVPKVIDFGVAKAAGQSLTDKTLVTGFGNIVGTLEYMSPEQAEINQLDIDTRSDIYSLGVLLYELLAGSPPFTRKELEKAGMLEMLRVIREQEPSKPSTKLSTAEALPTLAANRGTEPGKLTKLVRGELDWIVMKALEKDRNRRYETANAFAMDMQRYLADEPVQACLPSAWYRFRKFTRRNKRLLLTAGAFLFLLIAAVAGLTIGIVVLNAERELTEQANKKLTEEEARTRGALEAESKRRRQTRLALDTMSAQVIGRLFAEQSALQPEQKQFLEQALRFYEEFAADTGQDKAARAGVAAASLRVGEIRQKLGELKAAESAYGRCRELYIGLAGEFPEEPDYRQGLASCLGSLGALFLATGRPKEAEDVYGRAVQIQKQLAADFPGVPEHHLDAAKTESHIAMVLRRTGRRREAADAYGQAVAILRQLSTRFPTRPEYRWQLARTQNDHGTYLANSGQPAKAEEAYREAVALMAELPADFGQQIECRRSLANFHNSLGTLYKSTGRFADAERAYRQAIGIQKQLAAQFPALPHLREALAMSQNNVGELLQDMGRTREAAETYAQAISLQKQLAADLPMVPSTGITWPSASST
jgi:serine/threonine protein kinase/tetratricopeptide (TPR) repeat protein